MIQIVQEIWIMLVMASPFLLLGFFVAGMIHIFISPSRIAKYMGRKSWKSVFMASLAGVPLPLCSCSVLPTAAALRNKGAGKGATSSFLVSTPETGVDSIAITYSLMDLPLTIIRPIAAFATAFVTGIGVNLFEKAEDSCDGNPAVNETGDSCCNENESTQQENHVPDCECNSTEKEETCCAGNSHEDHSHSPPRRSFWLKEAFNYAYGNLSDDLAHWLALGFILSGILSAMVPADLFEGWIGQGIPSLVFMLLLSVPIYICASGSTPVAAVLIAKGLSPGAALVFLLAGPATNIGAIPVLGKILGKKALAVYLASIVVVSLIFGLAVNWFYQAWQLTPQMAMGAASTEEMGSVGTIAAVFMLWLLIKGMWNRPMPDEWKRVGRGICYLPGLRKFCEKM